MQQPYSNEEEKWGGFPTIMSCLQIKLHHQHLGAGGGYKNV